MDSCFHDITVEFLGVVFHNLLYYAGIYPNNVFETRKKYSTVAYHCIHPEIKQYLELCLRSASECLKNDQLHRVVFAITDRHYEPILRFVFDINKNEDKDDTADAYLVQVEQNFRAFCLKISSMCDRFKTLPEDCSFTIRLYTTESTAVSMATNPDFENFPLIEVDEKVRDSDMILPMRSFPIRSHKLDAYVEIPNSS